MPTITIPISQINPAPHNPRKDLRPEDPAFKSLVKSIDEFGMVEPLVWNERSGNLVGGHQRLKVLQAQGKAEVEVSVVDLPLKKEKALNLALNRIDGEWDRGKLATLLDELTSAASFDIGVTGFGSSELDELLATLGPEAPAPPEPEDQDAPVVTEPGELIKIGVHRVLCGDSADPETLERLMGSETAGMLHADPPYNVAYDAKSRPTVTGADWDGIKNDHQSEAEYREWTQRWLASVRPQLEKGSGVYIWNGFRNFGLMVELLGACGMRPRHVITWAKESFAPGHGDFNEQTEFCLYGRVAGGKRRWFGPKNESTLWSVTRDRTDSYVHPTQKALPLAERAIRNSSQRGEIVLDPFLGSGTTLVAAARMGRRCFGVELEPKYCDAVVRRLIATCGKTGVPRSVWKRWGAQDG